MRKKSPSTESEWGSVANAGWSAMAMPTFSPSHHQPRVGGSFFPTGPIATTDCPRAAAAFASSEPAAQTTTFAWATSAGATSPE